MRKDMCVTGSWGKALRDYELWVMSYKLCVILCAQFIIHSL